MSPHYAIGVPVTSASAKSEKPESLAEQFRPVLKGVSRGLDLAGLNVFFRTGFFAGTSTAWRGVSVGPLTLPDVEETTLARDQVLDAYIDLFRQAMSHCIARSEGAVCMGLSGGCDSRHILLELSGQNARPDLVWTIDSPSANEAQIATQVAQYAGIPHEILPATFSLADEVRKNELTRYSSHQHGWMMRCLQAVAGYDTIYDGIGGDVLSAGLFLTPYVVQLMEKGRIDEYAEQIVMDHPCIDPVLFPRADALHIVHEELRRYLHYPSPATVFWFANRTRREIATSVHWLIGNGKRVMTPFLEEPLASFLLSLPARMVVDHRLHADVVARAWPDCRIPYAEKKGMPARIIRRVAVEGILYGLTRHVELIQQIRTIIRLAKSVLLPGRRDTLYLARHLVWCSGLQAYPAFASPAGDPDSTRPANSVPRDITA